MGHGRERVSRRGNSGKTASIEREGSGRPLAFPSISQRPNMLVALRGGLMRHIRTLLTGSVMAAAVALALPLQAPAQEIKPAGVVTTLQGTATVTRVSTAQPGPQILPLKFKDPVQYQDRVETGDQSLARILLGGKAVVT